MKIGISDLDVSGLCLGGNPFGWTADKETSFAVLALLDQASAQASDVDR